MAKFKIGEVAILRGSTTWVEYNGMECTVIRPLRVRSGVLRDGTWTKYACYTVEAADGHVFGVKPEHLEKKRPPPDEMKLGSWDECPWQPTRELMETGFHD